MNLSWHMGVQVRDSVARVNSVYTSVPVWMFAVPSGVYWNGKLVSK